MITQFKCHLPHPRRPTKKVAGQDISSIFSLMLKVFFWSYRIEKYFTILSSHCMRAACKTLPAGNYPLDMFLSPTEVGPEGWGYSRQVACFHQQNHVTERMFPPVLLRVCFFVKSLTLEPEWGQQPSSPEIISSSNEISQFHKDISGLVCIASLCSPRGKGWPHVFSLFFPTLKVFLVTYYHISPVSLVTPSCAHPIAPTAVTQSLRAKPHSSPSWNPLQHAGQGHAHRLYQ